VGAGTFYQPDKSRQAATANRNWRSKDEPVRSWRWKIYALTTLPLRKQEVQTRMRLVAAPTRAWTGRRLMFQRRLVTLCAWLMRFPACGFLPQISHCCAIDDSRRIQSLLGKPKFYRNLPGSAMAQRQFGKFDGREPGYDWETVILARPLWFRNENTW
jgi:hypothetical protein